MNSSPPRGWPLLGHLPHLYHDTARFLLRLAPTLNHPPFAYFPFGAGPRSCIGEHFARHVMVLVIDAIMDRWQFRQERSGLPRMRSLLTLKPRGPTMMIVERR